MELYIDKGELNQVVSQPGSGKFDLIFKWYLLAIDNGGIDIRWELVTSSPVPGNSMQLHSLCIPAMLKKLNQNHRLVLMFGQDAVLKWLINLVNKWDALEPGMELKINNQTYEKNMHGSSITPHIWLQAWQSNVPSLYGAA